MLYTMPWKGSSSQRNNSGKSYLRKWVSSWTPKFGITITDSFSTVPLKNFLPKNTFNTKHHNATKIDCPLSRKKQNARAAKRQKRKPFSRLLFLRTTTWWTSTASDGHLLSEKYPYLQSVMENLSIWHSSTFSLQFCEKISITLREFSHQ